MKNYWLDGIMGVAVGDALGLPVQFMSREELVLNPVTGMRPCDLYLSPIGTWSDDTDTIAAIAGGLAGLYYGYDAIPSEWLEVLRKREWLEANAINGKGLE